MRILPEWGEMSDALLAYRGHECDGTGYDAGNHKLVQKPGDRDAG
jgi:hypothetical protein